MNKCMCDLALPIVIYKCLAVRVFITCLSLDTSFIICLLYDHSLIIPSGVSL